MKDHLNVLPHGYHDWRNLPDSPEMVDEDDECIEGGEHSMDSEGYCRQCGRHESNCFGDEPDRYHQMVDDKLDKDVGSWNKDY